MRDARDAHDDELRALDGFGNAVGGKRELGLAPALETVLGLGTGQLGANGHAGLVHVAERALEEWVEVADAHLLAGKRAICCAGLANCTTAEHGDRCVVQLLNIDGHGFLLLFHAGCSCALWQMFRHDYVGPRSNCSSAYLVAGHRYYEMMGTRLKNYAIKRRNADKPQVESALHRLSESYLFYRWPDVKFSHHQTP